LNLEPPSERRFPIKALSILQPFASLIVLGAKHYETRSWTTDYRGSLAIHASKRLLEKWLMLCLQEPAHSVLRAAGYRFSTDLPRGLILGTVDLLDCIPVEQLQSAIQEGRLPDFTAQELLLGDYRPGRYAWRLGNPRLLTVPAAATGRLRLFEVTLASEPPILPKLEASDRDCPKSGADCPG
jgi:hypothetical protein